MMVITVRYLGPSKASTTIQQIADESWWTNNNSEDITKTFPLTGIERENGSKTGVNDYAMYWLSTEGNATTAYNMYIYSGGAHSDYSYSGKVFGTPIRLLRNEVQKPSEPTDPEDHVKLPIEYIAEHNVAPDAKSFVTNNKNNVSGFFTWDNAINKFSSISIEGKNYHLPSIAEWRGIINDTKLAFKERTTYQDVEEEIQIGKNGELKVYRSDYSSPEDYVTYGLRFTGIDGDKSLLSAWRYQFVDDPNSDESEDMIVIITVRLLGKSFTGTIEDITNATYWDKNNSQDITKYIPLSGWINVDNEVQMKGSNARFLSSTSTGKYCWYAFFTSYSLGLMDTTNDWYYDLNDRYTVRLFED
ncbi:hypothetical protein QYZ87_07780 [Porphyromonadaceae bacterium W3.11]|nr:hypothetical protein [Porphyromonadaceae bacterium W3.11]